MSPRASSSGPEPERNGTGNGAAHRLCREGGRVEEIPLQRGHRDIVRQHDTCVVCHKVKLSSRTRSGVNTTAPAATPAPVRVVTTLSGPTATAKSERAWNWEGRIQSALAAYLVSQGWEICALADTESKQQGPDVIAAKGARALVVEVKGYPNDTYEDPSRRDEAKPTPLASQARQWFSHAVLKVMLLRGDYPEREIATAFADFPTYRNLASRTRSSFEALGVGIYFVRENGSVEVFISQREVSAAPAATVAAT